MLAVNDDHHRKEDSTWSFSDEVACAAGRVQPVAAPSVPDVAACVVIDGKPSSRTRQSIAKALADLTLAAYVESHDAADLPSKGPQQEGMYTGLVQEPHHMQIRLLLCTLCGCRATARYFDAA